MPATAAIPSRYELKYLLTERQAVSVRDYLWPHVVPDEHSPSDPTDGYPVSSLYLDSATRIIYRQAIEGLAQRFKLRLRFYDNEPDSLVFAEIKRRVTRVVVKDRVAVSREVARELASDYSGWPAAWGTDSAERADSESALAEFVQLRDHIRATGVLSVSYMREAYVSTREDYARITFDRDVRGNVYQRDEPLLLPIGGVAPLPGKVVLELKFNDRCPSWMHELARHFNLERTSVAKYVLCQPETSVSPCASSTLRMPVASAGKRWPSSLPA